MVGSSDSAAGANIVLNTIVAEAFCEACDVLERADDVSQAVNGLLREYAAENCRIIFNGDGYSEEWTREAERRALPNVRSMVEAIPAIISDEAVVLFEKFHVFTRNELESRAEVQYDAYAKAINIEARTMINMACKQIIPAVIHYTKTLADSVLVVKTTGADCSVQAALLNEVSALLAEAKTALDALKAVTEQALIEAKGDVRAKYYHSHVFPAMAALRAPIDKLEMLVDKQIWPMPSYEDLIFEV